MDHSHFLLLPAVGVAIEVGGLHEDGVADPLFSLNGTLVEIDLWGLTVLRAESTPLMVNLQSLLALRNP